MNNLILFRNFAIAILLSVLISALVIRNIFNPYIYLFLIGISGIMALSMMILRKYLKKVSNLNKKRAKYTNDFYKQTERYLLVGCGSFILALISIQFIIPVGVAILVVLGSFTFTIGLLKSTLFTINSIRN